MTKYCLFTNDVETTSIVNGGLRDDTGALVLKEGMPRLLDLYRKHDIKTTFFFTGYIASKFPEVVKMIQKDGHEVACHGLTHDHKKSFDNMSFTDQKFHLTKAKRILEDISGDEVLSFRAPALRVNAYTPMALAETGFKYDSSIAPQRLDMFMSLGSRKKLSWVFAPRTPYQTSSDNLAKRGYGGVYEAPVSSFGIPYIGTFMRISPFITSAVRQMLFIETIITPKPINFLIHPNELIEEEDLKQNVERRASTLFGYFLSDILRKRLKQKNLGKPAIFLYEKEIEYWKKKGFVYTTLKDYFDRETPTVISH